MRVAPKATQRSLTASSPFKQAIEERRKGKLHAGEAHGLHVIVLEIGGREVCCAGLCM